MGDRKETITIDKEAIAISFSAEPNPTVIDAVRTILLNHYAQTPNDPPHICRLQPLL